MNSEKIKRLHRIYMNLAKDFAYFSKDDRLKVGAVLVSKDLEKVLGIGYNGWEKGGPDIPDSTEPGKTGTVHAEINCMLKVDNKLLYPGSCMIMTHNPCKVCARSIVNFGIVGTLIYEEEYRDTSGLDILRKAGINCEKMDY
jgi:dCMP deaminase